MINFLQIENLTKSFGDKLLFENISLTITDNQRTALIAKNGTGKTTLLNIIAGIENYDAGNVVFKNDLRISYLPQSPQYDENLTVMQACFQSENEIVKVISEYEGLLLNPEKLVESDILTRMDMLNAWEFELK